MLVIYDHEHVSAVMPEVWFNLDLESLILILLSPAKKNVVIIRNVVVISNIIRSCYAVMYYQGLVSVFLCESTRDLQLFKLIEAHEEDCSD